MFTLKKIFPGLPETERGRPYPLKGDPKGKNFIYSIANSTIIRNAEDPSVSEIVTNHPKKVTSACYAPSGFYIASGDSHGFLKIWDTVNVEHAIKYEYQPISASIYDISWSDDSKRIVVAGDGREKFASAISWDTGTNIGVVNGHTKTALSADYRKVRPFGIVTASEDMTIIHHRGPPFKYDKTNRDHKNFVNCVRYSPDGMYVASAGQDGKINIYDGKTLDLKFELNGGNSKAHDGGVYAVSWGSCSKKLMSASGDRTCKIWDIEQNVCETIFTTGSDFVDQQLGCLWMGEHLISVALSGKLYFHDPANPTIPKKCYWGHNKGIISVAISEDKKTIITGSYTGSLNQWDVATGTCSAFKGSKFPNQVTDACLMNDMVAGVGIGKIVKFGSLSKGEIFEDFVSLDSEPLSVFIMDEQYVIVGCLNSINLISERKLVHNLKVPYEVVSIVGSANSDEIAACCSDKSVHFFKVADSNIELISEKKIQFIGDIIKISLSHDKKYFSICAASKIIYIYHTDTLEEKASWAAHANKVNRAVFSADDEYIASCGIDGSVNIWKLHDRNYRLEIRGAHRTYNCVAVDWLESNNAIFSAGQQDCTLKFWDLTL